MAQPAQQEIAQNLDQAIDRLHEDIARVELWAAALSCFTQPVPDYVPSDKFRLPSKSPNRGRD